MAKRLEGSTSVVDGRSVRDDSGVRLFKCPKCPIWQPATNFYVDNKRGGGISSYCKVHTKKLKRYDASYYHKRRARLKGDIDYEISVKFRSLKQSAGKRGLEFKLTRAYLKKLYLEQGGRCKISGLVMNAGAKLRDPFGWSVDRIDCDLGYVEGNVRFVIYAVNIGMQEWGVDRYLEICRAVTEANK